MNNQLVCPDQAQLEAFARGELQPGEIDEVQKHLADCSSCCHVVDGIPDDSLLALVRRNSAELSNGGAIAASADSAHGSKDETTEDASIPAADMSDVDDSPQPSRIPDGLPKELRRHARYKVVELIGKGGMGDVYKAQHRLMNRTVALKVINQELVQNEQAVERFRREVQSAARLTHPNIVTAHDAEQSGAIHYLVMEYVNGTVLSDVVKGRGPLSVQDACDYVCQVADGLQHAHEQGMVHRDIKPHNLMVTATGQVKILDFGLATLASPAILGNPPPPSNDDEREPRPPLGLTSAGSMMGTPDFISPEQASDARAVDIRSDIYSLGCTLYYLLTGRPPFTEGSAMEKVKAHGDVEPEPIENLRDDVPAELADVVRRMMAKAPAKRFQTPAEVAAALAPYGDSHRTRAATTGEAEDTVSTAPSRRSWWPPTLLQSLAFGAFALALGAIIFVATDGGTLVVESEDESVEINIATVEGLRIVDSVTGSAVKWLRSGEYAIDLKGDDSEFELNRDRFTLKRGGKIIVKVSRKNGNIVTPTISSGSRTKLVRQILSQEDLDVNDFFFLKVSPDGKHVAYSSIGTDGSLFVRNLESGQSVKLTEGEFASPLVWSPDSKRIAYGSGLARRGDELKMKVIDLDTKNASVVPSDQGFVLRPLDWSSNGRNLLCTRRHEGKLSLVLVSPEMGDVTPLITDTWRPRVGAVFSPDNQYVAFSAGEQSDKDIFVLAIGNGKQQRITTQDGPETQPLWSPTGKSIVYQRDDGMWAIAVENGQADGNPRLLQSKAADQAVDWHGPDRFYSVMYNYVAKPYVIGVDPQTGNLMNDLVPLSVKVEGLVDRFSWSPNLQRIAVSTVDGQLHIYSPRNESLKTFTIASSSGRPPSNMWWSGDGEEIFFVPYGGEQGTNVKAIDPDEGTTRELFPPTRNISRIHMTSDGRHMLFFRGKLGERTLVVSEVGKFVGRELLSEKEFERGFSNWVRPSFSPDGSKVLVGTAGPHLWAIHLWAIPVEGGEKREIPTPGNFLKYAVWDPSGRFIAHDGVARDGRQSVSVVNVESGERHELSVPEGFSDVRVMEWSGDGKQVGIHVTQSNFELCVTENLLSEFEETE